MGLSPEFLRNLREEEGVEEESEVRPTGPKPNPVYLKIRVYGPDTLYMTNVPRPMADKMVEQELATWVNEDAIKLVFATTKMMLGPGLTPREKALRKAREERRRR